jgi:uncharacterized protein YbjT (DUF2867 family)
MYLVLGASGMVGRRVVRGLLEAGATVGAVSRDPTRLADLTRLGAVPIRGDLRDPAWMAGALDGVEALVLSTHGLVPPTRDNHPGVTDGEGNRRIIDAARRAGVAHVVFVSATSGENTPVLFGRVKFMAEEYLRQSGLPHTIVRPTVFMETHAIGLMGDPLRRGGAVLMFGPGTTRLNWISADDVARFIVDSLPSGARRVGVFTIGGRDHLSRMEALALLERETGLIARRRHVPIALLKGMKQIGGVFNPGLRYLLDMAIAEATLPDQATWAPRTLDWTGPTGLQEVIRQWAREAPSLPD